MAARADEGRATCARHIRQQAESVWQGPTSPTRNETLLPGSMGMVSMHLHQLKRHEVTETSPFLSRHGVIMRVVHAESQSSCGKGQRTCSLRSGNVP